MENKIIGHLFNRSILFKECFVAGLYFHIGYDDEFWDEIFVGKDVILVRENNNKYDNNAIALALASDSDSCPTKSDDRFVFGYIPKSQNAELATMIDAGYGEKLSARISYYNRSAKLEERLKVAIYLQTTEILNDSLRVQSINNIEMHGILNDLHSDGFIKYCWGGFPNEYNELPGVGDRIVFIHSHNHSIIFFLTRIIAMGDDCILYMRDQYTSKDDDCRQYVLTNVLGPIIVDKNDLPFRLRNELYNFEATQLISKRFYDSLEKMFEEVKTMCTYPIKDELGTKTKIEEDNLPKPIISKYDLATWITTPNCKFYYRDTSAKINIGEYEVGKIIRSNVDVEVSEKFYKPYKKVRFLILSAHTVKIPTFSDEFRNKASQWQLRTIKRDSYFMVVDVWKPAGGDFTQILLVHLPKEYSKFKNTTIFNLVSRIKGPYPYIEHLVGAAQKDFWNKLKSTIFPRQKDKELIEIMKRPIGLDHFGHFVDINPPVNTDSIVKEFIEKYLDGDISKLIDCDLSNHHEIKSIIMATIFQKAWPNLSLETINNHTYHISNIINYQRLFGSFIDNKYFLGLDKFKHIITPQLMERACRVGHLCTTIGNQLIWPNNSRLYSLQDDWRMRGYFDRMLNAMYEVMTNAKNQDKNVKAAIYGNRLLLREYDGVDGFKRYVNNSMINEFTYRGKPRQIFMGLSINAKDFDPNILMAAVTEFCDFAETFIVRRSKFIVEILRSKLYENNS